MANDAIEALVEKYDALLRLRVERDEREADGHNSFPVEVSEQRGVRMRAIAERFPGALRELESSTAERLRARLSALAESTDGRELWVRVMSDFHALLREVLAIKRWLADANEPSTENTFASWHQAWPYRSGLLAVGDLKFLEAVGTPPGGRLVTLVWQHLATKYEQPREELEQLLRD